jgi:hypothetical protein
MDGRGPRRRCSTQRRSADRRRNIMHPMFIALLLETDADDLAVDEQYQQRRARQAKRGKPARVIRVAASNRDRPCRP